MRVENVNIEDFIKQFNGLWSQEDLSEVFGGVVPMTIWNWRVKRQFPEPIRFAGKFIRWEPQKVREWARQNGYKISREPKRLQSASRQAA